MPLMVLIRPYSELKKNQVRHKCTLASPGVYIVTEMFIRVPEYLVVGAGAGLQ